MRKLKELSELRWDEERLRYKDIWLWADVRHGPGSKVRMEVEAEVWEVYNAPRQLLPKLKHALDIPLATLLADTTYGLQRWLQRIRKYTKINSELWYEEERPKYGDIRDWTVPRQRPRS